MAESNEIPIAKSTGVAARNNPQLDTQSQQATNPIPQLRPYTHSYLTSQPDARPHLSFFDITLPRFNSLQLNTDRIGGSVRSERIGSLAMFPATQSLAERITTRARTSLIQPVTPLVSYELQQFSLRPSEGWVTVQSKPRKKRISVPGPCAPVVFTRQQSLSDSEDAEAYFQRKGQRHNYSKTDKQDRSYKSQKKLAYQKDKRQLQSDQDRGFT